MAGNDSLSIFDVTASALTAERTRFAVVAQNIANAEVAKGADGKPYRRQKVFFERVFQDERRRAGGAGGLPEGAVRAQVRAVPGPFRTVQMKGHPDADPVTGNLELPNVDVIEEMVDLMDASRTYEANLSALKSYRELLQRTLDIAR